MTRFMFTVIFTFQLALIHARDLPDIVIYLSDDMSQLDAGIYGGRVVRTPTLDFNAEKGMVFDRAFIASPSCAPSRAALLTGLMPARNGAEANHTYPKPGTRFLPGILQDAGYEVLVFGKVAHGRILISESANYGVDYYSPPTQGLAENIRTWFAENDPEKPVCLMVGDRRPHVPWTPENIYLPE